MKDEQESAEKKPPEDLRTRTKAFALRIIRLFSALPRTPEAQVIGKQLLKSGTSVGAQYREDIARDQQRSLSANSKPL